MSAVNQLRSSFKEISLTVGPDGSVNALDIGANTAPLSKRLTGTITTTSLTQTRIIVTGGVTAELNNVKRGDWLFAKGAVLQVRRIIDIEPQNDIIVIEAPFDTTLLVALPLQIVKCTGNYSVYSNVTAAQIKDCNVGATFVNLPIGKALSYQLTDEANVAPVVILPVGAGTVIITNGIVL